MPILFVKVVVINEIYDILVGEFFIKDHLLEAKIFNIKLVCVN
jgi:hypothetical protein